MAVEVVPSVTSLTQQLHDAKEKLKETDENIKKVTGRDAQEPRGGVVPRRDVSSTIGSLRGVITARNPSFVRENPAFAREIERQRPASGYTDEPALKRPRAMNSFHPVPDSGTREPVDRNDRRRGGWDDEEEFRRRKVQSTVIVDNMPKKTREERIVEAQVRVGDKDVARNRRIFGSLMGTLKKFQQEQNNRAPTDDRQKEIRNKLEEKETAEKREAQRERRELFWERKRKVAVVKFLETKVDIVKRFNDWELSQKPLLKFIQTEGPRPVCYMPKKMNKAQEEKLEKSRKAVEAAIQTRREYMESQLRRLDQKIDYMNRPKRGGQDVTLDTLEEDIQETKKKMKEEPLDDIDVEALLDDNEVEGLELIAIEDNDKSMTEATNDVTVSMAEMNKEPEQGTVPELGADMEVDNGKELQMETDVADLKTVESVTTPEIVDTEVTVASEQME